jgi:uncharacterized ferritin-like protein (DUF455 family)
MTVAQQNIAQQANPNTQVVPTPNWGPFKVTSRGEHAPGPRAMTSKEGVMDRLRAVAFAELQAREAFYWASEAFAGQATEACLNAWKGLGMAEDRHYQWLLKRLAELGGEIEGRPVSDQLWVSLRTCKLPDEFAHKMASAENRGRIAGERFVEGMKSFDPESAEIFRKISEEEIEHIRLAARYFPDSPFADRGSLPS